MKKLLPFLILLFACSAFGQQKFLAKVKIYVQHEDANVIEKMTSYISRELRSLNDVEITKDSDGFRIDVIMITVPDSAKPYRYAVSVVTTKRANCDDYPESNELLTNSAGILLDSKMKDFADNLVTKFDTQVLEPARELHKTNLP